MSDYETRAFHGEQVIQDFARGGNGKAVAMVSFPCSMNSVSVPELTWPECNFIDWTLPKIKRLP